MIEGRILIIPSLQGKLNFDGAVTEPGIEAILEKWLERHAEFRGRNFRTRRRPQSDAVRAARELLLEGEE